MTMDHTKRTSETPYCLMPLLDDGAQALWFESETAALIYQGNMEFPTDYSIQYRPKRKKVAK